MALVQITADRFLAFIARRFPRLSRTRRFHSIVEKRSLHPQAGTLTWTWMDWSGYMESPAFPYLVGILKARRSDDRYFYYNSIIPDKETAKHLDAAHKDGPPHVRMALDTFLNCRCEDDKPCLRHELYGAG